MNEATSSTMDSFQTPAKQTPSRLPRPVTNWKAPRPTSKQPLNVTFSCPKPPRPSAKEFTPRALVMDRSDNDSDIHNGSLVVGNDDDNNRTVSYLKDQGSPFKTPCRTPPRPVFKSIEKGASKVKLTPELPKFKSRAKLW